MANGSPRPTHDQYLTTDHLHADLRGRSVRGGAVTVAAAAVKFVVGLGSMAVLARLLTPEDFGLLAMVAGLTNFLARFKDLGLGMAIVQRKEISHDQVSTLFWLNVGLGAFATLLTAALASLVAWFYGEPQLRMITLVLAVAFIFGGLSVQHEALLRRQMRFTASAVVQIISAIVGVLAGIGSALLGAGYWALVVMQLSSALAGMIGLWTVCGWRPGRPVRGAGVRSMLAFGGNLAAANLLNYLARNLDNILIGWRWGAGALGVYAKAYQLLLLPIRQINGPLTVVAIPALSRLQDQPDLYRLYYQKAIQLLVTIGMPLVVFTFVAADKVILLVLGDQWMEAVPIFRMLGPAAFIGTFNVATGWVYISLGQTHRQFRWAVLATTVTIMGFLIGLHWGAIGVAASFSITSLITRYPGIVYGFRRSPLHVRNLLDVLWRPALASAAAGAVIFIGAGLVTLRRHIVWDLLLGLILYTVAYIFTWSVLPNGRRRLWDIVRLASELAGRPREQGHASQLNGRDTAPK